MSAIAAVGIKPLGAGYNGPQLYKYEARVLNIPAPEIPSSLVHLHIMLNPTPTTGLVRSMGV